MFSKLFVDRKIHDMGIYGVGKSEETSQWMFSPLLEIPFVRSSTCSLTLAMLMFPLMIGRDAKRQLRWEDTTPFGSRVGQNMNQKGSQLYIV